jgi:hypothetical protein
MFSNFFLFWKSCRLWDNVEKYSTARGHRWQYGACTFHVGHLRLQTHTHSWICNNYFSSAATMVAQMHRNVTLYIHCLSCFFFLNFFSAFRYPWKMANACLLVFTLYRTHGYKIDVHLHIHSRLFFTFMWLCIVTNFFIIKPIRYTNFTNLFWHETLHVSDSSSVPSSGVYSLYTQQWYMSYTFVDSFQAGLESCLQTCMTYTNAECTVNKLLMMDRRTVRNM